MWMVKVVVMKDGGVGEVTEAKYDVMTGGGENLSVLMLGYVLGVVLLLVMGLFGFVVFVGVCMVGFNVLFKTVSSTIRGSGAFDSRIFWMFFVFGMVEMG